MIASRWLPDPARAKALGVDCLRSVVFVVMVSKEQDVGCLDSLNCFKDAGLRLILTYGTPKELYPDSMHPKPC